MPFRAKVFDSEPRSNAGNNTSEPSDFNETSPNDDGNIESLECFLSDTTLHGTRYLFSKSISRRMFWIVALLASFSFCYYQAYLSGKEFFQRPYNTKITSKSTLETGLNFPAVTLCNFNAANMKKVRNLVSKPGLSKEEIDRRVDDISEILIHTTSAGIHEIQKKNPELFNRNRMENLVKAFSHHIEEMLLPNAPPTFISCSYDGLLCGAENFTSFTSSTFGQCFTFNSGQNGIAPLKATMAGKNNGLKLRLNVQRESYMKNPKNPFVGINVLVHDQSNVPFMYEYGFGVEPGKHTFCSIRMKKVQQIVFFFLFSIDIPKINALFK